MDQIKKFLQDRTSITVLSTLILIGLSIHFFFVGLLEQDLIGDVLALDSYGLYRFWNIVIGTGVLFVGYGMYIQNRAIVNQSLSRARDRVAKEAKELAENVDEKLNKSDVSENKSVEGEVVKKKKAAKK